MKIGTHVDTPKYGSGIVVDEEIFKATWSSGEAKPSGRFGVKLDNPGNWPCSKIANGIAYFYPADLKIIA